MENELRALEDGIGHLAALTRRLRAENLDLRQSQLALQGENKALHEKVENAVSRLQELLERLPEEAA